MAVEQCSEFPQWHCAEAQRVRRGVCSVKTGHDERVGSVLAVPAQVLQFHFHFPSEHAIDGSLYAGELHIVHQKVGSKGTDDLLVVGVMLPG